MHVTEVMSAPSPDDVARLVDFVDATAAAIGARPLSDHLWLDLRAGGTPGFAVATVSDSVGLAAFAQVSAANEGSALEAFGRPGVDRVVIDDAAETVLDAVSHRGGGRVLWWVDDPTDDDVAFADRHGMAPVRGLYEMRRGLPLDEQAEVETRPYRVGADDEAWLTVNNRAFADHGEQGGWTLDTLRLRQAESWFDPDGFRVHEVDGRLAAFCWTKIHHDHEPPLGEIYVIAVDPDFHGRGLGRQLTLAGLDSISARGIADANLYVDAGNTPAVTLYERLGFTVHRRRQAFAVELGPARSTQETHEEDRS